MRTLAVRQDNNGDVTLTGPALRALARERDVTLLCAPTGEGAARLLPGVGDVIVAAAEWIDANPEPLDRRRTLAVVDDVAARAFDEAFVFTSFHQSPLPAALLLRLAGIPFVAAISVDYPGSLLDVRVRVDDALHEVERNLALVGACGHRLASGDDGALRYGPLPACRPLPERFVALTPGATVAARTWRPERWRAFVRALDDLGYDVVVTGSKAERELTRYVCDGSRATDVGGETTFAEYAALVRAADVVVSGNTAAIHVAGAVGTPVVALFPPTIPLTRFAPFGVPNVVLGRQDIACAGCRARTCPLEAHPCLEAISNEDACEAVARLGARPRCAA